MSSAVAWVFMQGFGGGDEISVTNFIVWHSVRSCLGRSKTLRRFLGFANMFAAVGFAGCSSRLSDWYRFSAPPPHLTPDLSDTQPVGSLVGSGMETPQDVAGVGRTHYPARHVDGAEHRLGRPQGCTEGSPFACQPSLLPLTTSERSATSTMAPRKVLAGASTRAADAPVAVTL